MKDSRKKFKLTNNTKEVNSITLYQVEALEDFGNVEAGDLGGWVEKEENLAQEGNSWIYGGARVSGNARVSEDACVSEDARVSENAHVSGNAWVYGNAHVSGRACVYGNACVRGDAHVSGDARATKEVISFSKVYTVAITDNHIQYGCIQKTFKEWKVWLKSDEVIETERGTDKFKEIKNTLEACFLLIK